MRSQREFELGVGLMNENSLPMAFQHLLEAVRLDSSNAEAHNVLGVLYTARHNFREAQDHLAQALALTADAELDLRPSLKAEVHNNIGVLYMEQDEYDSAIREFESATADLLYTTPYLAWANLGYAHFRKQQYPDAVRALTQSVTLQRDFCLGYLRLGQTYLAMRDFENAEQALTHVVDVPNTTCNRTQEAWQMRGEARAQLGHREDATADFERCVELAAESEVGHSCRRYLETLH